LERHLTDILVARWEREERERERERKRRERERIRVIFGSTFVSFWACLHLLKNLKVNTFNRVVLFYTVIFEKIITFPPRALAVGKCSLITSCAAVHPGDSPLQLIIISSFKAVQQQQQQQQSPKQQQQQYTKQQQQQQQQQKQKQQ
jgi:hypothetical protein